MAVSKHLRHGEYPLGGLRNHPPVLSKTIAGVPPWKPRLQRNLSILFALLFLIASLPLFLLAVLLVKLGDRGELIYRSRRLGYRKRPFTMYKLRTLIATADERIHDTIVTPTLCRNLKLEHRFGEFLRETRLDELPQLFNILRGDMNFVGPRPIRPEIYQRQAKGIADFDRRFEVKPGLIGPSQVYTPHSAPKRLRSLLDNRLVRQGCGFRQHAVFVGHILLHLLRHLIKTLRSGICRWWRAHILFPGQGERRLCARVPQPRTLARLKPEMSGETLRGGALDESTWLASCVVENLSDGAMRINADSPLDEGRLLIRLERWENKKHGRSRRRLAYCHGRVMQYVHFDDAETSHHYVLEIEPASPLNRYRVEKYFLNWSIA